VLVFRAVDELPQMIADGPQRLDTHSHNCGQPGTRVKRRRNPDAGALDAQQLRDALAAYGRAGRRIRGGPRRPARTGRRRPASGMDTTEVREWANEQGIEVRDRRRVPAELVVKFQTATG
jgi:Lsr2